MKTHKKILLISGLIFPLCMQGQNTDTSIVKICCEEYSVEIQSVKPGDTIRMNTIYNNTINVIPYDTLGSMAIYEFKDQQCFAYKAYIGTGRVLTYKETFWDSENNVKVERVKRCYEQLKNGVWKYWNAQGKITRYEIYNNGILIRTVNP